jgi:hypothetical protein
MRVSGHPRTQANETTNETAAEAGGMTPPAWAREILLYLTRGEPARQGRSRRVESAVGIRPSQTVSH